MVRPDFTSHGGYRWPFPGNWAYPRPSQLEMTTGGACPQFDGDGLCLAKTWKGAASAGIPAVVALLCHYHADDVLGEDADKLRVRKAFVAEVFDPQALIRAGFCAGADLREACLRQADLRGADLCEADLSGADLAGAYLTWANLYGASLGGADLRRADLAGANLRRADLYGADLRRADLTRAYLGGAYLSGANLSGANLAGADLTGAVLGDWERGPDGVARRVNGGGR